jgi:PAS domain S-box-containing protein
MTETMTALPFLREGGEMGQHMRALAWERTPLGAPQAWPQSLKTAVSLMLRARQPVFIGWGPQLISLYNDGYIPICGTKHPHALARPMAQVWAEIWDTLSPINDAVLRGESQWFENMPFDLAGRAEAGPSYFSFSYTPLLDDAGAIGGIFCSAIETTNTLRLAERRSIEAKRQQRLFEQAPGFICTLRGPDHVFEFVNDSYRRLFNRSEFVGRTVREAFPELGGQGFYELLDQVYATGQRYVGESVPARLRDAAGGGERDVLLDFIYAPVFDDEGRVTGIFCEGHDVTSTHAAQQALLEKEEQLRLATDAAEVGLWDVNVVTDTLFWPPRVKAMFGIAADRPVSMADFYAGLHPEDRESTSAAFASATDPARRAVYDVEYRTIGKEDGRIRWVAAKGRGIFDAQGRCVRMIGTAIDITARKAAEEAEREAERRKDEFIATLAHELRNPLAPLRNAVHLLRVQGDAQPRIATLHEMMERQLNHLVRLVDDLLELARIRQGTLDLRKTVLQVSDFVGAATEAVEPLIRDRRHQLVVDRAPQPLWVCGDAVRLTQLVSNLLNNAARYTRPGGTIRLETRSEEGQAVIRVSDTGRGFAPQDAQRIFDMFARGDASGGLGIGLALGRKLAQLHGGTLEGASDGPGHGSVFTVRVPLVDAPAAAAAPASAVGKMPSLRVLVVDDNADAADTMELLLRELGAEVSVARDGRQALEKFEEVDPAVVLLDIGMPGMDGYEVARRLRARYPQRPLSIVGLSGWGQERDRQRGRDAGFDHHLVKPADIGALQTLLHSVRA